MQNILLLGGIIFDKILTVSSYPPPGADTLINSERIVPAGCALNTAITLKSFGLQPFVLSTVGVDDYCEITEYMHPEFPVFCTYS